MGDLNELVERLLARYWDLAYAEGREGRSHDTPAGDAQETLSAIRAALTSLIAERDGLERLYLDQMEANCELLAEKDAAEAQLKAARGAALEEAAHLVEGMRLLIWAESTSGGGEPAIASPAQHAVAASIRALSIDTNKGDGV